MTFSHLDADQRPTMVDVSGKAATARSATAEARAVPCRGGGGAARERLRSPRALCSTPLSPALRRQADARFSVLSPAGTREPPHRHRFEGDTAIIRCTVSVHQDRGRDGGVDRRQHRSAHGGDTKRPCPTTSSSARRLPAKEGGKSSRAAWAYENRGLMTGPAVAPAAACTATRRSSNTAVTQLIAPSNWQGGTPHKFRVARH